LLRLGRFAPVKARTFRLREGVSATRHAGASWSTARLVGTWIEDNETEFPTHRPPDSRPFQRKGTFVASEARFRLRNSPVNGLFDIHHTWDSLDAPSSDWSSTCRHWWPSYIPVRRGSKSLYFPMSKSLLRCVGCGDARKRRCAVAQGREDGARVPGEHGWWTGEIHRVLNERTNPWSRGSLRQLRLVPSG